EWLGLPILHLLGIDNSPSIEPVSLLGMRLSSLLLPNTQRLLGEQLGLRILPLLGIDKSQSIERNDHLVGIHLPHHLLLQDVQCSLTEGFRLRILPLFVVELRKS